MGVTQKADNKPETSNTQNINYKKGKLIFLLSQHKTFF